MTFDFLNVKLYKKHTHSNNRVKNKLFNEIHKNTNKIEKKYAIKTKNSKIF